MTESPYKNFRPDNTERNDMYKLLNSVVVPRPIAWISTVSGEGCPNIAPHSYTTVAAIDPPTILFVSIREKDTVSNIEQTGTFVYNVVDFEHAEQMNITAAGAPPGINEFELAGVTMEPSHVVPAPRVASAPVAFECKCTKIERIGSEPSCVIFGEILEAHVREDLLDDSGRVMPGALDAVARMGGEYYTTTRDRFELVRPSYAEMSQNR